MKKITALFCSIIFISCNPNGVEMKTFEKNVETSKKFYQAFSDKKLDEMKSFVTENYTWSPPPTGVDSLDVNTWYNSMQGFNDTYNNIEFTYLNLFQIYSKFIEAKMHVSLYIHHFFKSCNFDIEILEIA